MKYKFLYIFFITHVLYSQQFRNITDISDLNGFVGNNGVAIADYDQDGDGLLSKNELLAAHKDRVEKMFINFDEPEKGKINVKTKMYSEYIKY